MARRQPSGKSVRPWGRSEADRPPDGKIRLSQLVTTFGPGAMVDLVDHAVLVGGLESWRFDPQRPPRPIHEPRLRDILAERFRASGRELSLDRAFRAPPTGDDATPSPTCGVRVLEFPQWFVCQEATCRTLTRSDHGVELKGGRWHHRCSRERQTVCVPVRFVTACRRGHLSEFPWIPFSHRGRESSDCSAPQLQLLEGTTVDFSEVEVVCRSCNARARLSTANEGPFTCRGERPWLGADAREACEEPQRLLVRTASNSYFAQVVSALSIPDRARDLEDSVRRVWAFVQTATTPAMLQTFRTLPDVQVLREFQDTDVLAMIQAIRAGHSAPREALRSAEFRQLMHAPDERPGDLPQPTDVFFARRVGAPPLPQVGRVVVAPKLREVRVQVGFTRIEARTADLQGEFDVGVETAALSLTEKWLPATEVNGEGVFVAFDEDAVHAWETSPAVLRRDEHLRAGYAAWAATVPTAPPYPGVRFYMLHSLAHLLVTAISLECGYAASAIRERIYCAPHDEALPMAAILLSTGTSGTEGTLGGLVEQGRRLRDHLRRAWADAKLCSNDPVCAGHSPGRDPSERHLEGAACHGCLFIAECSCERFNRYLDRALVVPTIGHDPALAFFASRP